MSWHCTLSEPDGVNVVCRDGAEEKERCDRKGVMGRTQWFRGMYLCRIYTRYPFVAILLVSCFNGILTKNQRWVDTNLRLISRAFTHNRYKKSIRWHHRFNTSIDNSGATSSPLHIFGGLFHCLSPKRSPEIVQQVLFLPGSTST